MRNDYILKIPQQEDELHFFYKKSVYKNISVKIDYKINKNTSRVRFFKLMMKKSQEHNF